MKSFIGEQQKHMDQKLQYVVETTQEQLTIVKDLNQNKKSSLEESNKNFQDMKYSYQRQLHDAEKRLIDEIVQVRDDFDRQKRELENFYRNQMQTFHLTQTRDIEQCLKQGIENTFQKTELLTAQDIQESNSEMISKNQLQHRQMENHVKNTTKQQSDRLLKHCQESLKKNKDELEKSIKENLNTIKNQQVQLIENNKTQIEEIKKVTKMAWENEIVPKHIQEQLNKLHNNHQSEIKRLEAEIQSQKEKANDTDNIKRHVGYTGVSIGNVYDENSELTRPRQSGPMFEKRVDFLSPRPLQGTRWNSKSLFCRTNPSPVATVLPQRKPEIVQDIPDWNNGNVHPPIESQHSPATELEPDQVEAQQYQIPSSSSQSTESTEHSKATSANKQVSRKRKGTFGRRRKGKKRRPVEKTNTTAGNVIGNKISDGDTTTCDKRNTTFTMAAPLIESVYDFPDDDSSLYKNKALRGRNFQNQSQQRSKCSSPQDKNDASLKSSPSLSITEVLITRKVQGGVRDQATDVCHNRTSQYNGDVFSSPKNSMFELCQSKGKYPDEMMLNRHTQVQIPRVRDRRKLCDFDTHTQMFQMIQCLQKNAF